MKGKTFVSLIEIILGYVSILFGTMLLGFWLNKSEFYLAMGFYCITVGMLLLYGLIEWYLDKKYGKKWQKEEV